MKAEWKDVEFVFVQYKDTGISILSAVDDLQVRPCRKVKISCLLTELEGKPLSVATQTECSEAKRVGVQDVFPSPARVNIVSVHRNVLYSSPWSSLTQLRCFALMQSCLLGRFCLMIIL